MTRDHFHDPATLYQRSSPSTHQLRVPNNGS